MSQFISSGEKNSAPLVSVAVPVYNGANYMRDAIDSLLAQTYPNLEILVVNDGSKDDGVTEQIALSYGEQIRYLSKSNGGVASALNRALKEANGDYFCWLSHDDIYLPAKVAKEMEKLLSLQDSNAVIFCRYSFIDAESKHLYTPAEPPDFDPSQGAYQLILEQWLHGCSILAPKSLYLEVGGFREDLPTTQDYDLLVKIALRHPFVELPEILLKSRLHSQQSSLKIQHLHERTVFFEEHIPLLSKDYMNKHYTWQESLDAFLALGIHMSKQHYETAVLAVAKQLVYCESGRAEPDCLWDVLEEIIIRAYRDAYEHEEKTWKTWVRKYVPQKAWSTWRYSLSLMQVKLSRFRFPSSSDASPKILSDNIEESITLQESNQQQTASLSFDEIYETNGFLGTESRSGEGSTLFQTRNIRNGIPPLLAELDVKRLLDVPCGDWNWMRHLNLDDIQYTGGDIVQAIIDNNSKIYGNEKCKFEYLNIITGPLPESDLILCRDCLVHLNFSDGLAALQQFKTSGAKWLLITTFTNRDENLELYDGGIWRPLNLEKPPFNFPKADKYINEGCTEGDGLFGDKSLGLWRLN